MLRSLLARLFGRSAESASGLPPPSLASSGEAVDAAPAGPVRGARRPLISARGEVAGYEYHVGVRSLQPLGAAAQGRAAAAYITALMMAVRLGSQGGRIGFAQLPIGALSALELDVDVPRGLWVVIQAAAESADLPLADVRRWRSAGAKLGWPLGHSGLPAAIKADFHWLDGRGQAREQLLGRVRAGKALGLPVVVLDLDNVGVLEAVLAAGADYACCSLVAATDSGGAGQIAPASQRVLQLLNAIVQDADTATLVAGIKADVGLSYRLLRFLNSAGVGAGREIGDIQQAVLVLGRDELYRWLSILLVRVSAGRPASAALQEVALARARLFELLAGAAGEPRPGDLFTLGLVSMLGELLNTRLDQVIEGLQLPAPARQALLLGSGPWLDYLHLGEVVEQAVPESIEPLAGRFGGLDAVLAMSAEAWGFAAEAAQH